MNHPAKFSDPILERIAKYLDDYGWPERVLDPFAGVGKVHELTAPKFSVGVELEPEWSTMHPRNIVGNALHLPFPDETFDALVTSPCYGNRMADHHDAKEWCRKCDGTGKVWPDLDECPKCHGQGFNRYVRMTYRHQLGRPLHADNSGQLQWGSRYRDFHNRAWAETLRVLKPHALVVVNLSNHIRDGVEQPVVEWHAKWFFTHGCRFLDLDVVATDRMGHGANRNLRCAFEQVLVFVYCPERMVP